MSSFSCLGVGDLSKEEKSFDCLDRHEHSFDCLRANAVGLRLSEKETFSVVQDGVQRVNDEEGRTFANQKPTDVVTVVSGSLKLHLYFVLKREYRTGCLQQMIKSIRGLER